jgi:hypothetical protein
MFLFPSLGLVPGLFVEHRKVYSVRCEADVVVTPVPKKQILARIGSKLTATHKTAKQITPAALWEVEALKR